MLCRFIEEHYFEINHFQDEYSTSRATQASAEDQKYWNYSKNAMLKSSV